MRKLLLLAGVGTAIAFGATAAQAGTETFDNPVTLSPTEAPGTWYTDRFAPSGFATSGGNLVESIAGRDLQADAFYNTQGRAFDLGPTQSMSIDVFVDGAFRGSNQRDAGFWGVADDNTNTISAYPIIELSDLGNDLVFRGWNSNDGTWTTIASADSLVGSWQTLTISLDTSTDTFTYSAGGSSLSLNAGGSTAINSVILQGYNAGANYNISWDNLASPGVPEPAAWTLMILGFGGIGATLRRRAKAAMA
ncbi:MAG: PEP-CTERM sorting domain-containing protein [Proteobacteria bacterium]|nr:PEP-CTERM sorting domain-containing protein [Pseudomonadota bacterium]